MATKKQIPVKSGKTASKKVKKALKPEPKKTIKAVKVAPTKKIAPKKTVIKGTGKKISKPVPKKVVKPAIKKAIAKPALKKAVVKAVPKKVAKATNKPVKSLSKSAPKKINQIKSAQKPIAKKATEKPVAVKHISTKVTNPPPKIMAKKEETKISVAKVATEKAVKVKPEAEVKAKDIKVPAPKPVVIPKISTKSVRKYQPEFTKSVLDKAQRDPGAPSQRYSDVELQEFRELIQRKLEAAKKELSYLHGLITRKDEMGGDEGDNRYMTMEDGSLSMEREQLSQMASRQITFIDHLEKAVMRIENKTYGICRVTGKLIDKARLRAVPHATLSIEAKMGSAK